MATEKRERQRANRQQKIEAERKEGRQSAVKQRVMLFGIIGALVLGGLFLVSRGGGSNDNTEAITTPLTLATTTTTAVDEDATTTELLTSAVSAPEAGGSIDGDTACPPDGGADERITQFESAPPMCIDEAATYTAEVVTNRGTIVMELDAGRAPNTVNNFVVLARYGFYDGAPFHRIIPGFVIQGGDAVGQPLGTGDPGYAIDDELPDEGEYEVGSVAMANSGPNTSGSQFFVVTGDQGVGLPPLYSLFGSVTSGLDVVQDIESIPTAAGDAPSEPAIIENVTVTEN